MRGGGVDPRAGRQAGTLRRGMSTNDFASQNPRHPQRKNHRMKGSPRPATRCTTLRSVRSMRGVIPAESEEGSSHFLCDEWIVRLPISQLSRESIARTQFAGFHFHLRPMPNNTILTVTSNQLSLRDPACPRNFHVQYLLKTQFLKRKKSYLSFRYRLQNSFGYCWESRP